jgi:4-amino-4-deoxy-L-arabinose transferase-like glycosyltransferase
MTSTSAYFWPCLGIGMVVGIIAGAFAWRRRKRKRYIMLGLGVLASFILVALWHWPLGGADLYLTKVQRGIRQTLVNYEMTQLTATVHRNPLTRHVLLSGPADDFQRSEMVRYMDQVPGVESASWSPQSSPGVPLILEGFGVSILGFLFGLLLAYLVELHRRHNAQWNW